MTMFQILMAAGFVTLFVMLLYLWADIRELKTIAKESRRELLRSNFGERSARPAHAFQAEKGSLQEAVQKKQPGSGQAAGRETLKEAEEQVLQEVLTEFLG